MGEIYWTKANFLNFGDDLNLWLWPRLFPEFFGREDDDHLVGIGTILGNKLPRRGRLFIMGSGAGYAALPAVDQRGNWNPVFVRGPLTARVLGLPREKAITDGAFLAADLFPRPKIAARGAIFIPHWKSEIFGDWATVSDYAGLRHVSPMQPVDSVLSAIAGAELVVTESMHGAILADAMRVPWVTVRTSPEINDFKWIDWCLSVGESYDPRYIPPSGSYDAFRQTRAQATMTEETFAVSIRSGSADPTFEDQLVEQFHKRFEHSHPGGEPAPAGKPAPLARLMSLGKEAAKRYGFRQALLKPSIAEKDRVLKERAAISLSAAVGSKWRLSNDHTHSLLIERLHAAAGTFRILTGIKG